MTRAARPWSRTGRLVPPRSKDGELDPINTWSETAAARPVFRTARQTRHCLILVDGRFRRGGAGRVHAPLARLAIIFHNEPWGKCTVKIGRVNSKNQVTLPADLLRAARIRPGDHVRFDIDDRGRISVAPARATPDILAFIGVWKGRTPYTAGGELADDLREPLEP